MNSDVLLDKLEQAIRELPPARRYEVLKFIEFLDYRDHSEDADLWRAVEAHHAYRASHPDEPIEVYESAEDFLRTTENL
jgi:hypothetical protein